MTGHLLGITEWIEKILSRKLWILAMLSARDEIHLKSVFFRYPFFSDNYCDMDKTRLLFPKSCFNNWLYTLCVQFHTFCICIKKIYSFLNKLHIIDMIPKRALRLKNFQRVSFLSSTDQIVPSIWSLNCSPTSDLPDHIERYSRKVFVGGLPPDIDEGMVTLIIGPYQGERRAYPEDWVPVQDQLTFEFFWPFCFNFSSILLEVFAVATLCWYKLFSHSGS